MSRSVRRRSAACAPASPPNGWASRATTIREGPMHKIEIPAEMSARAMRARGREHIFERIDPARTAHVVVDLQNGFMAVGAPVEVPAAREIVANVNRICAALREAGGLDVFL